MAKLVIGMGITGTETARFLHSKDIPFDCFDDRKSFDLVAKALDMDDFKLFDHPDQVVLEGYDEVIISPGLRQDHDLLVRARELGVKVTAEVELAWRYAKGRMIGVTGSNGKSTTVSLIHHILERSGYHVSLCGNIGVPLVACVDDDPDHIYVLELSSFQLENIDQFRAHIGVLINVSPDHLDWHGGFENYEQAKLNLFRNQQGGDIALIPPNYADRVNGQREIVPGPLNRIEDGFLRIGETFKLPVSSIPLLGMHNRINMLFACSVVSRLGLTDKQVEHAIADFKGLEHRMEWVGVVQGRTWINDTKATNVHACQASVDAMEQPYVLILGGNDKGERFDGLTFNQRKPREIIAYGETADKIVEDLHKHNPLQVHAFKDACLLAHSLAGEGTAVLLAPACASFDQFENFAQRGKVFKQIFQEIVDQS